MCTADRASMQADFVIDGLHLIFRGLNKNEADKKSGGEKRIRRTDGSLFLHPFYKSKSKSLWLPN